MIKRITFCLLMCIGCQSTKLATLQGNGTGLSGSYDHGDGEGYNIDLDLLANGTYQATWHGCKGVYGTAHGTWRVTGDCITFSPAEETKLMIGHLRELHIVQSRGQTIFVPDLRNEDYCKNGPTRRTAYLRLAKSLSNALKAPPSSAP